MSRTKEVGTAVGTLACALAIGFAMQNTETASQRYGALENTTSSQAVAAATIPAPDAPKTVPMEVHEIVPTSALDKDNMPSEQEQKGLLARLFGTRTTEATDVEPVKTNETPQTPVQSAAATDAVQPIRVVAAEETVQVVETAAVVEKPAHICDIVARATPNSNAFVTLSVVAGCDPNTNVTVHHNGMQFTAVTDAVGRFDMNVPALSKSAVFIIEVEPGRGAVAQTTVNDLDSYNRVVVQWQGDSGFELHAREFGADYGTDGHIWHGAGSDTARLETAAGGHLIRLGGDVSSDALMADIYTFPAAMSGRNGHVDLSVEAVVTQANCGQMIEAQTLELRDAGELRTQSVTLAVPACDAIGNFMVLNNLLDDLQVAAR